MNIATIFHNLTKIKQQSIDGGDFFEKFCSTKIYFKEYLRLPRILLPERKKINNFESTLLGKNFDEKLKKRNIFFDDLSTILFYSGGITDSQKDDWDNSKRAYPSLGKRFPLEIYPIILKKVSGIEQGIYHYNVKNNLLERLVEENNLIEKIYPKIIWQSEIKDATILVAVSCVFWRTMVKHKERGYRYALFEAGHLGQNINLVSSSLGIKCIPIGEFNDDEFSKLLDTYGEAEDVIHVFALSL